MIGRLPYDFSYKSAVDLVRIGRNNDGGYLVSQSDIEASDILVGLGINDDWSFESCFKKINFIEVFAYDASISQQKFVKNFIKSLAKIYKPNEIIQRFNTITSYHSFFSDPTNHHIKKYVGLEAASGDHCTLSDILHILESDKIFLKVDIEGSEYRLLDEIIQYQSRISGAVIEFHDCDIHLQKIVNFISNFKLRLVHIHANNFSPIRRADGLPLVLEMSFSGNAKSFTSPSLPHILDMPNSRNAPEIHLVFEENLNNSFASADLPA